MTPWAPGTLRRADHRPQIVGIAQLVAHNEQGCLSFFLRNAQDLLHRGIFPYRRHCDHTLVGMGVAHCVELAMIGVSHHDPRLFSQCHNLGKCAIRIAAGYINFIDRGAGAQGLRDGVASFDQAVRQTFLARPLFSAGLLPHSAVFFFRRRAVLFPPRCLPGRRLLSPASRRSLFSINRLSCNPCFNG